jgi:hypothetical protein
MPGRGVPAKVANVNSTDLFAAASLACGTMSHIFNADDHEIPFFGSEVWPNAQLAFNNSHTESHVPGRHLNALLAAEHVFGIHVAEDVIEKHARAAFFSYSGPIAVPLNRDRIGGSLNRFLPHNIREGFHALYALVRFRKSARARELAEKSIADINRYWNPERGWDRAALEGRLGLKVIEWPAPFITGLARAIGPLVKYYRATGYAPALELAITLKERALLNTFGPGGGWELGAYGTHTHSTTCTMSSLAQLADVTSDAVLMARVKSFFDNGLKQISDEIGWSIENTSPDSLPDRGESNNTGDILETALLLGRWGWSEYYGVAERILRAHLLPSQLRDVSFIQEPLNPRGEDGKRSMAQRHLGAWGFPAPYGHWPLGVNHFGFNMDIVGGAVGSICEAQLETARTSAAAHMVNMWFDRDTEGLKVESLYPSGTAKIHIKRALPLFLRMPGWAARTDVKMDGTTVPADWTTGGQLFIGATSPGQTITIRMPLVRREIALRHRSHPIRVRFEGDRVTNMDNFGTGFAFFDPMEG